MTITKEGFAVIEGDNWISKWVTDSGKLAHDEYLLPLILPHIPVGGTVIDVGANIGSHTVSYLAKVGPEGTVHAFEPNALAIQCLRHNCPRAVIHFNALSDCEDILELEPSEDVDNIGAYRIGKGPIVCHAIPLDSLNLSPDFIKADCEGSEMHFLKGAEATIQRCRPRMVIEINSEALERFCANRNDVFLWLKEHGYSWKSIQDVDVTTAPQFDILCLPVGVEAPRPQEQKREETGKHYRRPSFVSFTATTQPPSVEPWKDKAESLAVIKYHATELKKFAVAPMRTKAVRDALREAGVIK